MPNPDPYRAATGKKDPASRALDSCPRTERKGFPLEQAKKPELNLVSRPVAKSFRTFLHCACRESMRRVTGSATCSCAARVRNGSVRHARAACCPCGQRGNIGRTIVGLRRIGIVKPGFGATFTNAIERQFRERRRREHQFAAYHPEEQRLGQRDDLSGNCFGRWIYPDGTVHANHNRSGRQHLFECRIWPGLGRNHQRLPLAR